jgi:hypothetical protein
LRFWRAILASLLLSGACAASEYRGQVLFGGLPVPGATVTAVQGKQQMEAITDETGLYVFPDLAAGHWTIEVKMTGFAPLKREVVISPNVPEEKWDLAMLPPGAIQAQAKVFVAPVEPEAKAPEPEKQKQAPPPEQAADGFLINGSMNNGATSPFAQAMAFGNNRTGGHGLYNGGIGLTFDNSALDAKPFSLTGQDSPKAAYNRLTGLLTLGGPLKIPHLLKSGPVFFVGYQWTRNSNATTETGLVPTLAQRDALIPASRISPQALALLNLYPLPNFAGSQYNYQIPVLSPTHMDNLQTRLNKSIGTKDQVYGKFALESTRSDQTNLFGFQDATDSLGLNASANWSHRFNQRLSMNLGVQFSRLATHQTPYFENRENVSGLAGITGNNQQPMNWGPPSLTFSSGISSLSDGESSFDRNQTSGLSYAMLWNRMSHNVTFGTDFRRQEFNYLSQQNPRGSFTFTGAATGSDLEDFLLGVPDASSISFGNADKYLRQSVYDAYATDDWRVGPEFTLNAGVRWEYGAPATELYGRLANLEIAPGFTSASPVSQSLLQPDRSGIEPRIGIAWRASGSSLVVRAGYGVYYDTSVYQNIALQLAQQPPFSKTLSVQNSAADPLTLANGFVASPLTTPSTFAVNPDFRVGYAQIWNVTLQRDLPGSLQVAATYVGTKGTRGTQEFLPNTYPAGALNPCPTCPVGFAYLTSNGNSTRESAQIQLRRRLHNGLTASISYTFSKSLDDDAALGGQGASTTPPNYVIAQNWLNLSAERGLSTFDQRHLLNAQAQYTTGMGMKGGTLLTGWRGALLKEWTFLTQITAGSGLPETPIYLEPVEGTGFTGTIRPDVTGAPVSPLKPAFYAAPLPGQWGTAARDSIIGPAQFSFNASLGRTFRVSDKLNLDLRVDSTNALNHVNYSAWNTTVNNAQFGLPAGANPMRSMQTTLRLRF